MPRKSEKQTLGWRNDVNGKGVKESVVWKSKESVVWKA